MRNVIREILTVRLTSRSLAGLVLIGLLLTTQPAFGQGEDMAIAEAEQMAFTRGQSLYNQGLYSEAIVTLSDFLAQYPGSIIKDLGLLWLGRSYLAQGDIANAERVGLRLKDIPDTPLASLYEDELRIGRQTFARAASPKHSAKREVAHAQPSASTSEQSKPKVIEMVAATPTAAEVLKSTPATKPILLPEPVKTIEPSRSNPKSGSLSPRATEPSVTLKPLKPKAAELVAVMPTTAQVLKSTPTRKPTTALLTVPEPVKTIEVLRSNSKSVALPVRVSEQPEPPAKRMTAPEVQRPAISVVPAERTLNSRPAIEALPLLRSRFEAVAGSSSYRLVMVNEGAGRANDLTIRVELDPFFNYVNSDLLPIRQEMIGQRQVLTFRVPAVEAGETKAIQISVRKLASASSASSAATPFRHSIFYKDFQGRFQHTP